MFVITSTDLKPKEIVEKFFLEHREYLDVYYKQGIFLAFGRVSSGDGGVILATGKKKDEIEKILEEDPFTREGISRYKVIEFSPIKVAEGLEKLK